ncbi:MAG: barstar family protein [Anaerolineae bacterium]|nr:barstar family protein [Anaerolineae bacterium]
MISIRALLEQGRDSGVYYLEAMPTDDMGDLSSQTDFYVAYLDGRTISSKQEFFDQIKQALQFPYFGNNWDALRDCLGDLSWLPAIRRIVVFDNFQNLANNDKAAFTTAVDIMQEATAFWRTYQKNTPPLYILLRGENALLPDIEAL